MHDAVRGHRRLGTRRNRDRLLASGSPNRIRVAPPIQQKVLVLHVHKHFRVERHSDKVEVRVETVHLDGVLDVISRGAVAVVVDVLLRLA